VSKFILRWQKLCNDEIP